MKFELNLLDLAGASAEKNDALIVLVNTDFLAKKDIFSQMIAQAIKNTDFEPLPGKQLSLYRPAKTQAVRVILAGIGAGTAAQVRHALHSAIGTLKTTAAQKITIAFASELVTPAQIRAAVLAVADASYVYTASKSTPDIRKIQHVVLGVADAAQIKAAQPSFTHTVATVTGIELAKEWGNRPANYATPTLLAKAAQALAKLPKITCEVLGLKEVSQLGMGAFMAVAQGSDEPLRFIILKYEGAPKTEAPLVLVGKGITFDSGGISIKPAAEMDEMKFDMCGAASVLGTFRSLAELQPAINVIGLIPSCENLPSGKALKPGDVVTSMSGKTIEVLNTDAEGRLILCDALTYAERFKPRFVVDIATLTGACVIALGATRSGLFTRHDALGEALFNAGEVAQDLCWKMPLDDDYAEGLKSSFADIANVAGRAGGAVTAAKFLEKFTQTYPWAHLDIAGSAWKSGAAKGATGRPVGLLVEFLLSQAQAITPVSTAAIATSQGKTKAKAKPLAAPVSALASTLSKNKIKPSSPKKVLKK